MTSTGFREWCRYHCSLVAIRHADYDAMLAAAEPLLRRRGISVEELDEASEWMFMEQPDLIKAEWGTHVGHLLRRIHSRRHGVESAKATAERNLAIAEYDKAKGLKIDPEAYKRWLRIVGRPEEASMPKEQS